MANTVIQLKKSATPAAVPASLANGELAINFADGKLYYKAANGTIAAISGSGGAAGDNFGIVNANGTLILSDIPGDTLTLLPGQNITITGDAINDRVTIGADLTAANSWANTKLSNGTVTLAGALTTTGQITANSQINITPVGGQEGGELQLLSTGANSNWSIDAYQNNIRIFTTTGTTVSNLNFFHAGSGFVRMGVNRADPTYTLDVGGTVNASAIYVNGVQLATGTVDLTPANSYTNTSTTAANNYAGAMANSVNAFTTATYATITNATAAFAFANGVATNTTAAFSKANNALANTTGTFNGTLSINGDIISVNAGITKIGWNNSGQYFNWFEAGGAPGNNYIRFATGNAERMRLANGNLGIGTSTPAYLLDVAGTINALSTAGDGNGIRVTATAGYDSWINLYRQGYVNWYFGTINNSTRLDIKNDTLTAMSITSTGNFGIGTTIPSERFHVANGHILLNNNYGLKSVDDLGTTRELIIVGTDGTSYVRGFRGSSMLTGVNGATYLYDSGGAGTIRVSVIATGNVGIGTTSPTHKLDVAGSANISLPTLIVSGQNVLSTIYTGDAASNAYTNVVGSSANNYAGAMANSVNAYTTATYATITTVATNATSANNYAGAMANAANAIATATFATQTTVATNATSANNYAGAMANAANAIAATIVAANLDTARAYTNTSTTAANNYAGVMANSSNGFTGTVYTAVNSAFGVINAAFGVANGAYTSTNGTAAFAAANQAGVVANNANTYGNSTYVKKAGDTITGDLVVQGNLTTSGVVTYANTQTLLIGDSLITLNNDIPAAVAPSEDAGVEVKRGSSANVALLWNEGTDRWTFTNDGTNYRLIASNTDVESANNYAGAMANSGNSWTQTIVDANLVTARAYTNTSTTAANNYAGVMANSANAIASATYATITTVATNATSANNYAGAMANSGNVFTGTVYAAVNSAFAVINAAYTSSNADYTLTNAAFTVANAAFDKANIGGGGASTVNVSSTGPTGNTNGSLWWNTNLGRLFIYYTDGDSNQWVEASPSSGYIDAGLIQSYVNVASDLAILAYDKSNAAFSKANNASVTVSNVAPSSPSANSLWWNSSYGRLYVYYSDGDSSQWVEASPSSDYLAGLAFDQANLGFSIANSAFGQANLAFSQANSKLGNASVTLAGTLTTTGAVVDSKGDTRDIPPNDRSSFMPYSLTISDTGKMVIVSGNTAAAANVFVPNAVFSIGNTIMITNQSTTNVTITQNSSVTMFLAGNAAASGNRTLAGKGIATIICVGANNFIISGAGLT